MPGDRHELAVLVSAAWGRRTHAAEPFRNFSSVVFEINFVRNPGAHGITPLAISLYIVSRETPDAVAASAGVEASLSILGKLVAPFSLIVFMGTG